MNKKEFSQLSIGLKAAYPRFQMLSTDEEMTFWYRMLQDIEYPVAQNAVLVHISTNVFPPSIAEIRKLCMEQISRPSLSYDEAWGTVMKAIGTCGRDNPEAAFGRMDDVTAEVVKNLGWTRICTGENLEATRAAFRNSYEDKVRQVKNERQIPAFVREQKLQLTAQFETEGKLLLTEEKDGKT